jgi:FtsH-binding integral membrane protein
VLGIVAIFVQIPTGTLIYAILGLVIFAGLTAFDLQRLGALP